MHDNFEDHDDSIEYEIEIETDTDVTAIPDDGLVLARDTLPGALPIIPLRPRPAFPGVIIPLTVNGRERVETIQQAMDSASQTIGLVMVLELDEEDAPDNLQQVGVAAKILKLIHAEEESAHVLVNSLERFVIEQVSERKGIIYAEVDYPEPEDEVDNAELKAYSMAIIATLKELVQINPLYSEEIKLFLGRSSMDDPARLADFAANLTNADGFELQEVLETLNLQERIEKVLILLKKELEVSRLQTHISQQIEEKISAQQREFFLREQFKAIKKELGLEKEGKVSEIEKFQARLKKLTLNKEAQNAVDEEIEKLQRIEPSSP